MIKCKMCEQDNEFSVLSDLCYKCFTKEYIIKNRAKIEAMGGKIKPEKEDELYGRTKSN